MNKAMLIGNLTKDPEMRVSQSSGVPLCTFTVAVSRRFSNAQGEREADFIPVVTWRTLAENCNRFLRKGSQVAVCGAIQTRSYDASDGTRRYVTEVVAEDVQFLNRIGGNDASSGHASSAGTGFGSQAPMGAQPIEDDSLPF